MFVRDCMTRNPITLRLESDPLAGIALCKGGRFRHLPVVDENDRLVGVVSRNDLERFLAEKGSPGVMERQHYVKQVDIQKVPHVQPDFPLEEAIGLIVENKVTCLPVLEDDNLVGIVTETDLLEAMLEVFSGRQKGIRLTALVPYVKGSLAVVSAAIAKEDGIILSLNIFEGTRPSNWGCTLKVTEISQERLLKALEPIVLEVLDVREIGT
ncbi:MAG: Inosine-5'-monophosphate dehydrogenase [Chloroflexi bacterium]|nr:Inosine-5'-monophosphate dehydrogenase [Chloroflexota bacterium]